MPGTSCDVPGILLLAGRVWHWAGAQLGGSATGQERGANPLPRVHHHLLEGPLAGADVKEQCSITGDSNN